MSRALGAMVARHVQLASLGSSHLAALRGAPTRLRPHAQVVRPISASGATWEGDGRKLNVYTGTQCIGAYKSNQSANKLVQRLISPPLFRFLRFFK